MAGLPEATGHPPSPCSGLGEVPPHWVSVSLSGVEGLGLCELSGPFSRQVMASCPLPHAPLAATSTSEAWVPGAFSRLPKCTGSHVVSHLCQQGTSPRELSFIWAG